MKVAVAMSGGVDSSVSALLLKKEGFEVIGVSFLLFEGQEKALERAKKVADALKIEHHLLDLREIFKTKIINYFIESYARGLTPNPCALCNRLIKFGVVAELVKRDFGAEFFATGHYVEKAEYKGLTVLKTSRNRGKDQSYFLALLPKEVLPRVLFPVGAFESKEKVRALALKEGLNFFQKEESQDICFLKGKSLSEYLREALGEREGEVIYQGRVVGKHKGIHFYTIGQRRGLGLPLGKPLYVIRLEPKTGRIYLGEKEELFKKEFFIREVNFQVPKELWERPYVQIRYRTEKVPLKELKEEGEFYRVILERPVRGVTPGQVCAFYDGEILLGGGIIVDS